MGLSHVVNEDVYSAQFLDRAVNGGVDVFVFAHIHCSVEDLEVRMLLE